MYYKCELRLNGISYNVTDDIVNWEEIDVIYKRTSMSGVSRSFVSSIQFCGPTHRLIRESIMNGGLSNDVFVSFFVQNNSWTWNKVFECQLDVPSLEINDNTSSFSCIDESINDKLKAMKGTKFEYLVSGMTTERLQFDRLKMNNYEEYTIAPEMINNALGTDVNIECVRFESGWNTVPIYTTNNSIPVPGLVECRDQDAELYEPSNKSSNSISDISGVTPYLCRSEGHADIRVRLYIRFGLVDYYVRPTLGLYVFDSSGRWVKTIREVNGKATDDEMILDVDSSLTLSVGQRIVCMARVSYADDGRSIKATYLFDKSGDYKYSTLHEDGNYTFRVDWENRGKSVNFQCVRPINLLQTIIDSICGSGVSSVIVDDDNTRLKNCRIVAAESVRRFNDARIYTSFSEFCSFMEALFGYIYTVDDDEKEVRFLHRDSLFVDEAKKIDDVNDFSLSVDSGLLYSSVEVGNDVVTYEEDNGRYEMNFKQVFSTGNASVESKLTLKPSYRVDCFGLEYLVEQAPEENNDSKSDKDVWAIMTTGGGRIDTSDIVRRPDGSEIAGYFNIAYHPRNCIVANSGFIATFADRLNYASSDGYTGASVTGLDITGDVDLTEYKRYSVFVAKFTTLDLSAPVNVNAMIEVEHFGRTLKGWINNVKYNYTKEEASEYTLMLSSASIGKSE